MSLHVAYPYRIDERGRTAASDDEQHLRELVEQVLFTSPGERIHRPNFGSGLLRLVFEPASEALTEITRMTVQGALQQWLGERIQIEGVRVERVPGREGEGTLRVEILYRPRSADPSLEEALRTLTVEQEV